MVETGTSFFSDKTLNFLSFYSIAMMPEENDEPNEPLTVAPSVATALGDAAVVATAPIGAVAPTCLDDASVAAATVGPKSPFESQILSAKICPMCESQFSTSKFSQDAFEAHVLAHFQV